MTPDELESKWRCKLAQAISDWTVSQIIGSDEQQKALGTPGMTPQQVSSAVYGAESADYTAAMTQANQMRQYQMYTSAEQQEMAFKYANMSQQKRQADKASSMEGMKGVGQLAGQLLTSKGVQGAIGKGWSALTAGDEAASTVGEAGVAITQVGTEAAPTMLATGASAVPMLAEDMAAYGVEEGGLAIGEESAAAIAGEAATGIGLPLAGLTALGSIVDIPVVTPVLKAVSSVISSGIKAVTGGTVICTELNRQGLLSDDIYMVESMFGQTLPPECMDGYHSWAVPVVRSMRRSKVITYIVYCLTYHVIKEMAHRIEPDRPTSLIGSFVLKVGIPFCAFIGRKATVMEVC